MLLFKNSRWRIKDSGRVFWKSTDFLQILCMRVFGVADYESDVTFQKFKMADARCWTCFLEIHRFSSNFVDGGFWSRWSRIYCYCLKIQYGGSNMADVFSEDPPIFFKFCMSGFFWSLIMNWMLLFKSSRGRIQDGEHVFYKSTDFHQILYIGVFDVSNYEFSGKFSKI